jgi:hypothetical protein
MYTLVICTHYNACVIFWIKDLGKENEEDLKNMKNNI